MSVVVGKVCFDYSATPSLTGFVLHTPLYKVSNASPGQIRSRCRGVESIMALQGVQERLEGRSSLHSCTGLPDKPKKNTMLYHINSLKQLRVPMINTHFHTPLT